MYENAAAPPGIAGQLLGQREEASIQGGDGKSATACRMLQKPVHAAMELQGNDGHWRCGCQGVLLLELKILTTALEQCQSPVPVRMACRAQQVLRPVR
jgi:hypothetical protein